MHCLEFLHIFPKHEHCSIISSRKWNVALPSFGRHFCLSCGLPMYPGAQLVMVKTDTWVKSMTWKVAVCPNVTAYAIYLNGIAWNTFSNCFSPHQDNVLGYLTAHSTGQCSLADRQCTGSLHFQGSHRWGRTCFTQRQEDCWAGTRFNVKQTL